MNKAIRYLKTIIITQKDGEYFKEIIKSSYTWKDNCRILDVGCGPGNVTHDCLLPILPKKVDEIIAIDKMPEAIQYANQHYGKKSKILFKEMNILSPDKIYYNYFHHVFSFYCLHFVEQETEIRSIYKLLRPGGDFFFTFGVQCNLHHILKYLSEIKKWKPYVSDVNKCMPHFQDLSNPMEELEKILLKVGFQISYLNMEPREYLYPAYAAIDVVQSVCTVDIPENLESEFNADALKAIKILNYNRMNKNNEECYHMNYQVLYGHVTKPIQ